MNNLEFQQNLLDLAEKDFLLLTESERFAHQLLWRFRRESLLGGRKGWETPAITTLNQWMERLWMELWPDSWPASQYKRWHVLQQCIETIPPPDPLQRDIPLILALDESFEHCLRYGLDPGDGDPANGLVEWRRSLWNSFHELLARDGLFHPAALPQKLYSVLSRLPERIPPKLAAAGFEFSGFWEKKLFELLHAGSCCRVLPLPLGEGAAEARIYADPEQELYALMEMLVADSRRYPLHELAVVVLDSMAYAPLLAQFLQDILGRPLAGGQSAYNLLPDRSLLQQPLFQAALLPLHFADAGQPRSLLFSLLRSPYYERLGRWNRFSAQWDRVWREERIEKGLDALVAAIEPSQRAILPEDGKGFLDGLSGFLGSRPRRAAHWLQDMKQFWELCGFPVLANERDQMAWQRLSLLISTLEAELGSCAMERVELKGWLEAAARKIVIQETGYEDAGIQIIGSLEARGLAFQRLFVPGVVAGALPQPARTLPFLSIGERAGVQGGTVESQFEFGRHLFSAFHAVAPGLVLSRPMMSSNGEPRLPSPFWPENEGQSSLPVIPWRHALPALQRAQWVRDGIRGMAGCSREDGDIPLFPSSLQEGVAEGYSPQPACLGLKPDSLHTADRFHTDKVVIPSQISVSELEILLACSSRFFFQCLLGLKPLPLVEMGVAPSERGEKVHRLLAAFARGVQRESSRKEVSFEDLSHRLREAVLALIAPPDSHPLWNVEARRLLGAESDEGGLLFEWLQEEWKQLQAGWRWAGVELDFSGLQLGRASITLKGRLDRLDVHGEEGLICWDYKTGRVPSTTEVCETLVAPQLPAYLLALRQGLVREAPKLEGLPLAAGYIDLRSVRYLRHFLCLKVSTDESIGLLERWEEHAAAALQLVSGGDLTPCWMRTDCSAPCAFQCLCGKALWEG